jgi:hypothetical protein
MRFLLTFGFDDKKCRKRLQVGKREISRKYLKTPERFCFAYPKFGSVSEFMLMRNSFGISEK